MTTPAMSTELSLFPPRALTPRERAYLKHLTKMGPAGASLEFLSVPDRAFVAQLVADGLVEQFVPRGGLARVRVNDAGFAALQAAAGRAE